MSEAKKRYGLAILNDTVTSNHIHLLVVDGEQEVIPKRLQLIAGKTAQAFNRLKARKGAFWEDRYHATAIETGEHLLHCLVYIDLNRVRNGVVHHPCAWQDGVYHERQNPLLRYTLIHREKLLACCGLDTDEPLRKRHRQWIEEAIHQGSHVRQPRWTESLAVGSEAFVQGVLQKLALRAKGRRVREDIDHDELREPGAAYDVLFARENWPLSVGNAYD